MCTVYIIAQTLVTIMWCAARDGIALDEPRPMERSGNGLHIGIGIRVQLCGRSRQSAPEIVGNGSYPSPGRGDGKGLEVAAELGLPRAFRLRVCRVKQQPGSRQHDPSGSQQPAANTWVRDAQPPESTCDNSSSPTTCA